MDFPAKQPEAVALPPGLLQALGLQQAEALYRTDDYLVVVEDESIVAGLDPDFAALAAFEVRGVAVTAPGRHMDFVSRWFGPRVGVNEDPVTGSAHTSLATYWSQRLGKRSLSAEQGGARKGQLHCEVLTTTGSSSAVTRRSTCAAPSSSEAGRPNHFKLFLPHGFCLVTPRT